MTFVDLLSRINTNTLELCSTENTTTPYATLVNIASLEGLLTTLKEKLGIIEEPLEDEETNADVFVCVDNYAYAEMPGGNKKWFKKTSKWEALDYDPELSILEEMHNEHIREFSEALNTKLENIFWPVNSVRGN